jgi:hypothetical protein
MASEVFRMTPMLRYCGAAAVLKLFGLNGTTRRLYRSFGNRYGQPRREKLSEVVSLAPTL